MAFSDPDLNRLAQQLLTQPSPQQPQPLRDPRAALTRVLQRQRRRALRLVNR